MSRINNKQVGVWRGTKTPPTTYHVWIKNDTELFLYDSDKEEWITFLSLPELNLKDISDNPQIPTDVVRIYSGNYYFDVKALGTGLNIYKNNNQLIFSSSAITTIPTDEILNWNGKTLIHVSPTEDVVGTYGPNTSSGTSSFTVPKITVDKWGHITSATQSTIEVPANVVLNPIGTTEGAYPVLLAASSSTKRITGETNKTTELSYEIRTDDTGEITHKLNTPGLTVTGDSVFNGNITVPVGNKIKGDVEGNVSGTATPTNHADKTTQYGAGDLDNYGHVKLLDDIPTTTPTGGSGKDTIGIAATPLMVYSALKNAKEYADNLFGDDFTKNNNKYQLDWIDL